MKQIKRNTYTLLLGQNSCDVFYYYGVDQLHGLNLKDCKKHKNTKNNAYIFGLANYVPKLNNTYSFGDERFVFINLERFDNNLQTFGGIFHELMHHSFEIHNYNLDLEEDIITWAENESYIVFDLILKTLTNI